MKAAKQSAEKMYDATKKATAEVTASSQEASMRRYSERGAAAGRACLVQPRPSWLCVG